MQEGRERGEREERRVTREVWEVKEEGGRGRTVENLSHTPALRNLLRQGGWI